MTVYREKFNNVPRHEHCTEHQDQVIEMFCEQCDIPVCSHCRDHQQHKLLNIRTAYQNKLLQFNDILNNIGCKSICNAHLILNELKSDFTTCHKEMDRLKTAMVSMSKRFKNSLDKLQVEISLKYKNLLVFKFLRKKEKMKKHIARIQMYEHIYDKFANRPVQFLKFIKTVHLPQIQDTPQLSHHCLLSLSQKINTGDMVKLLSEIKITQSEKNRQAGNELLPTLMSSPVLQKSTAWKSTGYCYHISCVTPDRVWVSVFDNIYLMDTATRKAVYRLEGSLEFESGKHTVNCDSELIYIEKQDNINKLSADMNRNTLLIDKTDPEWKPICVYCSPSSGDLLVGMRRNDTDTGKVMRYNDSYRPTQTIPPKNTPDNLYQRPRFITENNNGDVVVSDCGRRAVVVTSSKGIHRFSYKGSLSLPSGSQLVPRGVCTDALSHILVSWTNTVQMLSEDGEFLKILLTYQILGMDYHTPHGLSYDFYTNCLWVGSETFDSMLLSVYKYINPPPAILGNPELSLTEETLVNQLR